MWFSLATQVSRPHAQLIGGALTRRFIGVNDFDPLAGQDHILWTLHDPRVAERLCPSEPEYIKDVVSGRGGRR